jgi:hypothetical protein
MVIQSKSVLLIPAMVFIVFVERQRPIATARPIPMLPPMDSKFSESRTVATLAS